MIRGLATMIRDVRRISGDSRPALLASFEGRFYATLSSGSTRIDHAPRVARVGVSAHWLRRQTAQHVRLALVCSGGKSTGEMDFTASGTDRVIGKMTLLMRSDRGDNKLNMELNSRWVSSDCGGLKPGERQQLRGG
jgi:hypothetical protein